MPGLKRAQVGVDNLRDKLRRNAFATVIRDKFRGDKKREDDGSRDREPRGVGRAPTLRLGLAAAMQISVDLMNGKPIGGNSAVWLRLLIGFDVLYTTASLVLVETVLVG